MSAWQLPAKVFRRAVFVLALGIAAAVAACGSAGFDNKAGQAQAEAVDEMKRAFFNALSAEKCALRAADRDAVRAQRARVAAIIDNAQAKGFGAQLDAARAEWTRFDSLADWVCAGGDPGGNYEGAVDRLEAAVQKVAGER